MNNKSQKKERNDSADPAGRTNSKHKDTLFRCIFTFKKEWLLELYNAVNGTAYTNPDDITFTTIGDAVYIEMKNDISFLISEIMNFYEHQSTFNPNMPVRMLIYSGMVYSRYVEDKNNDFNLYGSRINKLPVPKCVCFYNGKTSKPDVSVLKLSDAFGPENKTEPDIEVKVTMLNINYGHNLKLMEACKPLQEYAWFVNEIRSNQSKQLNTETSIDRAIDTMPDDYRIKSYLLNNRAEVKRMCITEFNKQKFLYDCRREAEEERERADRAEAKARDAETKARDAETKARDAEAKLIKVEEEKISFIRNLMNNSHMSAEEAMKTMGINTDDFQKYTDILLQQ